MKQPEIKNIEDWEESTPYIKPKSVTYVINGYKKKWDLIKTHDSVSVLLYHTQKDAFVFVKQFRIPVFLKNSDGYTYELCAGLMDKNLSPEQTVKEEIIEEVGYDVKLEDIEKITSCYTAVGFAGSKQNIYFAAIDDSMKVSEGGGDDSEDIEVVYIDRQKVKEFITDESRVTTSGLMFAVMWFFLEKNR